MRTEVGQYLFLERPPMTTSAAKLVETKSYNRLRSFKTGLFMVIGVSSTIVLIDKDGIGNTLFVDWTAVAPVAKKTPNEDNRTQGNETDNDREEAYTRDTKLEEENSINELRKYAVDRIFGHIGCGNNVKYFLRSYRVTPADDKVERSAHIPEHFITRYWHQMRKKDTKQQE